MKPILNLTGTPAFANRCFMLDVSRNRMPTLETLGWLVGVLGQLQYTELQLYIEDSYQYEGHDTVWAGSSALSPADITTIRQAADAAGLKLGANVNCFGHMERWLRHDQYRLMAECRNGMPEEIASFARRPTCVEPTPANAAFAVDLARQMVQITGSETVMIGGDEPFELGMGASKARVEELGRDHVYREHLGRIMEPLLADGRQVLFWADQFRQDPAAVDWIPSGATGVVWNYEAPEPPPGTYGLLPPGLGELLGLPEHAHLGFAAHARLMLESGKPTWLACGTSSWNTFLGRNTNAAANIDDAARVGSAADAQGFLLADWGDNGHWQPLAVSLPSLVRGAAASWHGYVPGELNVGPIVDKLLGAPAGTGALIDKLGRVADDLGVSTFNGTAPFAALMTTGLPVLGDLNRAHAREAQALLDQGLEYFGKVDGTDRWAIAAAEMTVMCQVTKLGIAKLSGASPSGEERANAVEAQRNAWLLSSQPGGLDESLENLSQ